MLLFIFIYKQLKQISISSYTDNIFITLIYFYSVHTFDFCHTPVPHLFSPLSYICFPVFSSPRSFWVIWLLFHLDNCHHPVSALSGRAAYDPCLPWRARSCSGMGSLVPLLSATDPQWFHLCLLCLPFHRLLLLLWNDAWTMLGHPEAKETQHLDDHCFTATDHRIKEWFRWKGASGSHLVQ